jgi:hypothetical protein
MYTIYNNITGQIVKIVNTSNIDLQLLENESYLENVIDDSMYYIENGSPVEIPPKPDGVYDFDYTTKTWIPNTAAQAQVILSKRNELLYSSDWTQIPNNPLTTTQQEAWATYRQELRDISAQSGYPFNVIWPTPPQG